MLKKNEKIKTGIMTALVVFAAIMAVAVVMSPLMGVITQADAFRSNTIGGEGHGPGWSGCVGNPGFGC
jgi:hypothetical protein